jgi:hypothetical protein
MATELGRGVPWYPGIEAGGTTATPPLLDRLATALGLTLTVSLPPAGCRSA